MGEAATKVQMTPAEFLAFERASDQKHEYANGEIFAMSGGTRAHSLIGANVVGELRAALLARPCEVHGSDLRVKIEAADRYVYPDALVVCGEPQFEDMKGDVLLNPKVIVEVLSDSTEQYDRGDKFAQYRSIPSMMEYVLVSQHRVLVEHFERLDDGSWRYRALGPGESLALVSLGAEVHVPVDKLYHRVEFTRG